LPELPEVETVRRGLAPIFEGQRFTRVEARRENLRFPFPVGFVQRLTGRRVLTLGRRAKYLLAALDNGETLVMHLGMSGSFRIEESGGVETPGAFHHERSKDATHDHVVFHFESGARVVYNDPRRFGFMDLVDTQALDAHPLFANIGVEPLSEAFDAARLSKILAGVRAPLKAALLDQRRIAGLGNIYVCESLHRARLSPLQEAGAAPRGKVKALHRAIREVLEEAIEAGGSTLRDHRQTDGALGYFQHTFAVYDREGVACGHAGCAGEIARVVQGGRSTFYCPTCQR
jgi:formamidopyrimidine-DNA glycosylase